jgi:hypothetical protein
VSPERLQLTPDQLRLLEAWYPHCELIADHSWGLVGTRVLEIRDGDDHVIVKAVDDADYHLPREIRAHREWLAPWTSIGRAPELLHANEGAGIIATRYLPGQLVQGSAAEDLADTYRQAGELLAMLHGQCATEDHQFARAERDETLRTLEKPHRLDQATTRTVRKLVEEWPVSPVVLVPTHGDWHPRNWLVHEGVVLAIDFGRAALRPAASDFGRLSSRQFRRNPHFEEAFLEGYGTDPRTPDAWTRELLREAIGVVTWAYAVGDEEFELEGRRNIAELLTT